MPLEARRWALASAVVLTKIRAAPLWGSPGSLAPSLAANTRPSVCDLPSRRDAEQVAVAAVALGGDDNSARALDAADPAVGQGERAQRCADGAGEMQAPLAPVKARPAQ